MWRATLLASLAATAGILAAGTRVAGQEHNGSEFVAFRVDGTHAIAAIKVFDTAARQIIDGLSAQPVARFGFRSFELPPEWGDRVPGGIPTGPGWVIQTGARATVHATAERIVGGQLGCVDAIGVMLRINAEEAGSFSTLSARYFLAAPAGSTSSPAMESAAVRAIQPPASAAFRSAVQSILGEVLARELPQVRAEAEPDVARMASSGARDHRSWAQRVRAIDVAMEHGDGSLTYDVQSFRLSPDGVPVHFVRAEWKVRGRQGFAASLWLRGEQQLEIIDTNVRPASWLRMWEFQGEISREHLGLVLDVFDHDHDGWGEVLFAQGGYEGLELSLLELSPTGFHPTGIGYSYGC